jgi:thioredoxin 2
MTTVRCPFCLTLNRIDLARAADRPRCGKCERPMLLDRPVKVAQDDFTRTVLEAEAPVLVDFYADWCGPCKVVAPVVDELAHAYLGRLLVAKVDSDQAPQLSMQMGIRGIPTLILFRGGAEVGRVVGADVRGLRELVKANLQPAA